MQENKKFGSRSAEVGIETFARPQIRNPAWVIFHVPSWVSVSHRVYRYQVSLKLFLCCSCYTTYSLRYCCTGIYLHVWGDPQHSVSSRPFRCWFRSYVALACLRQTLLDDPSHVERIMASMAELIPAVTPLEGVFKTSVGHHSAVRTSNIARAMKFYSLLGMKEVKGATYLRFLFHFFLRHNLARFPISGNPLPVFRHPSNVVKWLGKKGSRSDFALASGGVQTTILQRHDFGQPPRTFRRWCGFERRARDALSWKGQECGLS